MNIEIKRLQKKINSIPANTGKAGLSRGNTMAASQKGSQKNLNETDQDLDVSKVSEMEASILS